MRVDRFSSIFSTAFSLIFCLMAAICASGQASYTAQIRGVVKDASGALVPSVREPLSQAALSVAEEIVNLSGQVIGTDLPSSDSSQVNAWRDEWSTGVRRLV